MIRRNVKDLQTGLEKANTDIGALQSGAAELSGRIDDAKKMIVEIAEIQDREIKRMDETVATVASVRGQIAEHGARLEEHTMRLETAEAGQVEHRGRISDIEALLAKEPPAFSAPLPPRHLYALLPRIAPRAWPANSKQARCCRSVALTRQGCDGAGGSRGHVRSNRGQRSGAGGATHRGSQPQ
jgi:hypothetical protein